MEFVFIIIILYMCILYMYICMRVFFVVFASVLHNRQSIHVLDLCHIFHTIPKSNQIVACEKHSKKSGVSSFSYRRQSGHVLVYFFTC